MVHKDAEHKERWGGKASDPLDRELDRALARCTSVEPRPGLEERVWANLQSAQAHNALGAWWRWSLVAAVALAVFVVALVWRASMPGENIAQHPPAPPARNEHLPSQVASTSPSNVIPWRASSPAHKGMQQRAHKSVIGAQPRLDRFPSPQQLSEQEKILANYVAEYPQHAALIARARTEALQKDREEEQQDSGAVTDRDSQSR